MIICFKKTVKTVISDTYYNLNILLNSNKQYIHVLMNRLLKYTGIVGDIDNSPCALAMWPMESFILLGGNSYFREVYCNLHLQGTNRPGYL
jgi:hypothetical protein